MDNVKNLHIIIFFLVGIILFMNSAAIEMQPWDEGLYAYRAVSIAQSGNLIDQTNESLAGLYSSTSPPFTHWIIFCSTRLLGENLLAVRLFSLLCSMIAIITLYYISLRVISKEKALLIPIVMSSALIWNQYSRQAMTDIPLIAIFLLSFLLILKFYESGKNNKILLYAFLFSIIFAIGLMTKIVISLFPLLFVFIYILTKQKVSKKFVLIIASLLGIGLALPWYIYMIQAHGAEFYNALFMPHITTAVENNSRQSGVAYYINAIIVSSPFVIFAFLHSGKILKLKDFIKIRSRGNFIFISFIAWFSIMFLVFTVSSTKMPYYTNYFFVPMLFLSIYKLDKVNIDRFKARTIIKWILITFLTYYWSFSFDFRQEVKQLANFHVSWNIIIVSGIILFTGIFYKFADKEKTCAFTTKYFKEGLVIISVILLSRIFFINFTLSGELTTGGEQIVKKIRGLGADTVVYVFNNYANSDSLNPQLEWYIYKNYPKNKKPILIKYPISKSEFKLEEILKTDKFTNYNILYYIPSYNDQIGASIIELSKARDIILGVGNYLLYTKIVKDRRKGLQV